jgi:hypothetical protein
MSTAGGNYLNKCYNISLDNNTLRADCRNSTGKFTGSSLTITKCPRDSSDVYYVTTINGVLDCYTKVPEGTTAYGYCSSQGTKPSNVSGLFINTCTVCYNTSGNNLIASCKKMDNTYNLTNINITSPIFNGIYYIGNYNGTLICDTDSREQAVREQAARDQAAREQAAQNMASQVAAQNMASQVAAQNMASQVTAQNMASQFTVSQNMASQVAASQNMASQNMASQFTASQNMASQVAASQNMASQVAAS